MGRPSKEYIKCKWCHNSDSQYGLNPGRFISPLFAVCLITEVFIKKTCRFIYQHLLVRKNNTCRNIAVIAPCGKPTKWFTQHKRREVLHRMFMHSSYLWKIESVKEYWFLAVRERCKRLTLIFEDKAIRICIRLLSAMLEYAKDKKSLPLRAYPNIPKGL